MRRIAGIAALYAAAAALLTVALYGPTIHYGFDYDDYHFVRPYPAEEIRAAFHGRWDPAGIEVAFYRPLTIVLYAVRFHFFGVNATAYHALSLCMFAAAATLFGLLARNLISSTRAGALALVILVVHPSMPYSAVAWVTNQMHLLQMLVVLTAMLWWCAVAAGRGFWWWLPLVGFEVAALMVKEDGVMLIPAILVLEILRRIIRGSAARIPALFIVLAAAAGAGLLWFRGAVLQGIGGYAVPTAERAWSNVTRGLDSVFRLVPARRPWQGVASWFVTLVPVVALASWRRVPAGARYGMCAGLAIAVLFDLPFAFVTKVQQMHLVAVGASLLLASAIEGLYCAVPWRAARMGVLVIVIAGLSALTAVTRDITRDFEPFGKIILATDKLADWAAVPLELREYLARKQQPGARDSLSPNPADALDYVAFGLHGPERAPGGLTVRWMSGPVTELYVRRSARMLSIPLRHERGAFAEPARLRIEVDGTVLDAPEFQSGDWKLSTIALRSSGVSPLRRMHRVVLRLDHAWVPAKVSPGSTDGRTLGLQVGEPVVR